MNLLLDTHILLCAMTDHPALPKSARLLLNNDDNIIHISSVSFNEIAIKYSSRKGGIDRSAREVKSYTDRCDLSTISFTATHALILETLPWHHRDPFDRMLVAQALAEPLQRVTHNAILAHYSDTVLQV